MSNVAFHNSLLALLVKIYKPIYTWCLANLATKTELTELETLIPVDVNSLTPSSTFAKNSVIGINGVLYRSLRQTSHSPVVMAVQDGAFVTHTVNGRIAFVVDDTTIHSDWELFTDASVEYWIKSLNARITTLEGAFGELVEGVTYNGTTYTPKQLLTEVAKLMDKTVVTES